jgi:hypothetical protein
MMSSATCLWKTFREAEHHSGIAEKCSASARNRVHLHPEIVFRINPESCSASSRNRVQLRPDSPRIRLTRAQRQIGDVLRPSDLPRYEFWEVAVNDAMKALQRGFA